MKYFFISNIIAIVTSLVIPVVYLICCYDYMRTENNIIILLFIFESLVFTFNVDFYNYKKIYEKYRFKMPKIILILLSFLLTIGCIVCIHLMESQYKWYFLIGIILSHIIPKFYVLNKYVLPIVGCSAIFPIFIMHYRPLYIIVIILSVPYFWSLAYCLNYTNIEIPNYDYLFEESNDGKNENIQAGD